MRFLLATYGTRGDVQPMLALGGALERAGHTATLLAPPNFEPDAVASGVTFAPVGGDIRAFLDLNAARVGGNPLALMRAIRPGLAGEIRAQFEALGRFGPHADAIVAASLIFVAPTFAEHFRIPYRFVLFAPEIAPSALHGPALFPWQGLPPFANRFLWGVTGAIDNWLLRKPLNEGRRQLGLPPVRDVLPHLMAPASLLLAADPELAPMPLDLAGAPPATGAWHLADGGTLDRDVLDFVAAGEPPVYVGFGSMPDPDPAETTGTVAAAIREVGCRAFLAAGWAGLGAVDLGSRIRSIGPAPHDKLFPLVAAAVHHGGAGTTHAAARAGVPQVIVPHTLDQFAWARRVHARGLGPKPVPRRRLTAKRLAAALRTCLGDAAMRRRTAELGSKLAARDGLAVAVAHLSGSGNR